MLVIVPCVENGGPDRFFLFQQEAVKTSPSLLRNQLQDTNPLIGQREDSAEIVDPIYFTILFLQILMTFPLICLLMKVNPA